MRHISILGLLVLAVVATMPGTAAAGALTGPGISNIDTLLIDLPLPDDRPYRRDVVFHDSLSTVEILQLREGLETVRHDHHHVTVFVVRGATRVTLDSDKRKLPAGAIVNIPLGTPYSFHSVGHVPAVLVFVYSPKFSGKDRIFVN